MSNMRVMAGLVPAIDVFAPSGLKTRMSATSAGMTVRIRNVQLVFEWNRHARAKTRASIPSRVEMGCRVRPGSDGSSA
jgi:hypothetical protein